MKKNPNLIHLLESFALAAVLGFFLVFMKRGEDAFFAITFAFSAFAFLFLMLMIYVDGDKPDRGTCKLLGIARSDLAFYALLLQFALSTVFIVWHNLTDLSIPTVTVIYALLLIAELIVIFIPVPKESPAPAPTNEGGSVKGKSLAYYAAQLKKLVQKCEFASLSSVMEKAADLLVRLDPEFSVGLDDLENDISHKYVKIENALLTNNGAQLLVLERELSITVEQIEKHCARYKYCLKDEGFYHVDDEIAMAQIDRLLDKLGLEYEEDLPTLRTPIDDEFFFKKALQFASDEYAALLNTYNAQIIENAAKDEADRIKRTQKRLSAFAVGSHLSALLLVAVTVGLTLFWHLSLQPNGLRLSKNDDGTLTVVGYNIFYGDEPTVPSTINGKRITAIGRDAFTGSTVTRIELAEGIETIEYEASRDCAALEAIVLPKSLRAVGNYAFKNDSALTKIYYRGSEDEWAKVTIGDLGNDELEQVEIEYEYKN